MSITCPVQNSLKLIGGKWKIGILYSLRNGAIRFGALKRLHSPITQQMLSKQLKEMEADDLVLRKVFEVIPPRVEYSLSDFGKSLIPILDSLCKWSIEHEEFIEAIIEDKFIS